MEGPQDVGAEFLRWEVATAAAGLLLGVNPFDEPNVQQAKDATRALLDIYKSQRRLPLPEPHATFDGARLSLSAAAETHLEGRTPLAFLSLVRPADYVALAFQPSLRALARQRAALMAVLQPLPPVGWDRAATILSADKPRQTTVLTDAWRLARHERLHLQQLTRLFRRLRR